MSKRFYRRWARGSGVLLAIGLAGCAGMAAGGFPTAGYQDLAADEAAWRAIEPRLVGMPVSAVEACAGPPQATDNAPAPAPLSLVYQTHDLRNYCRVALGVMHGRVSSVAADHAAPEFMWLRDGTNYCGRLFRGCVKQF